MPVDVGDAGRVTVTAMSSGGGWNGSGQLPLRAVERGDLGPFGAVDDSEGGNSQRHALALRWRSPTVDGTSSSLLLYLVHYRFTLFSNFTFNAVDPVHGDQIEQVDVRTFGGADARTKSEGALFGAPTTTTVGVQVRTDQIDNGLFHDERRERLARLVDAGVGQGSFGVFVDEEVAVTPWLRAVVGARADGFGFQVDDRREDLDDDGGATSGVAFAGLLSPKASLIVSWPKVVDLYVNTGLGFHSNDARGVVKESDPVTPLTRGAGAELGARSTLLGVDVAAAAFVMGLEGETVWVGDEGTTGLRGATLRNGVEVEARAPLGAEWLRGDVDVNWTQARFIETGDPVPLAPTLLVDAGVSMLHPNGLHGRLGVVTLGDRAANEDASLVAKGFVRVDGSFGWKSDVVAVDVDVQNLLNTDWREAQFANVSQLPDEKAPVEDLHVTPGAPLNGRLTLSLFF